MVRRDEKFKAFPDVAGAEADADRHLCERPGCAQVGEFRAPRSRQELREFRWFCLDHIRDYNKSWNFCHGMSEQEIEATIRSDITWNRPSWPLGAEPKVDYVYAAEGIHDPFGVYGEPQPRRDFEHRPGTTAVAREALSILDLRGPVTVDSVKARYKALVKRHHPDANGGDKSAEEKFKRINQAYQTVMSSLQS